jgi:hypothetical protein
MRALLCACHWSLLGVLAIFVRMLSRPQLRTPPTGPDRSRPCCGQIELLALFPPAFQRCNDCTQGGPMTLRLLTISAAVLATTGLATDANAQQAKSPGTVTLTGCTRPVVPFCTTMAYRGTTYVLHGISPIVVPADSRIKVTGTVSGTLGICPGTQVTVTSWSKVPGVCR